MNNAAMAVVGLAVVGGVAFAVSKASASGDDAGTTPPDSKDGPEFDVQAQSGIIYKVRFVKAFETESGNQTFWDIFTPDANEPLRVLRYSQLEDDINTRIFVSSPLPENHPAVDQAMRDFGIRFEGGPIFIPAAQTTTLPGQVMVSPGHWMATASIGFPKNLLVSASLIKAALEEQGWRNVAVFTSVPKFWPISKDGDYFIEGDWTRDAQFFQVPSEVVDLKSTAVA